MDQTAEDQAQDRRSAAEDWAQDQRFDALKKRVEAAEAQLQSLEDRLAPFEPLLRFLESLKGK
jgi:cell division protein FtsB